MRPRVARRELRDIVARQDNRPAILSRNRHARGLLASSKGLVGTVHATVGGSRSHRDCRCPLGRSRARRRRRAVRRSRPLCADAEARRQWRNRRDERHYAVPLASHDRRAKHHTVPRRAKGLLLREREVLRKVRRDELAGGPLAEKVEKLVRPLGRYGCLGRWCGLCR